MRQTRIIVVLVSFLFGLADAHGQQTPESATDSYAQQLKEYDRRVKEQQLAANQQSRNIWLPLAIIYGAGFAFLTYSQSRARRQLQSTIERSRADVQRSLDQGERTIELLESINRKLDRAGP